MSFLVLVLFDLVLGIVSLIMEIFYINIKFVSYMFQSNGTFRLSMENGYKYPFISWIPCFSNYIIGKFAKGTNIGVIYTILSILNVLKYLLLIPMHKGNDILRFIFIVYPIFYFFFDMIVMSWFYTKVYTKPKKYILITIFTLGLTKPFFVFANRFKK